MSRQQVQRKNNLFLPGRSKKEKKKNPLVVMNFVLLRSIYDCEETECVGCNRGNEWAVVQQFGDLW